MKQDDTIETLRFYEAEIENIAEFMKDIECNGKATRIRDRTAKHLGISERLVVKLQKELEQERILADAFSKNKLRNDDLQRVLNGTLWTNVLCEEIGVGGRTIVDVLLTLDVRILAACVAAYIRQRARKEGLKEVFEGGYRRDIIGMEGNLAVAAYVYGNFLEALGYVNLSGKSDAADLEIGDWKVDVKTGTKAFHKKLMISKKQWENPERKFDFYVGCTEISEDKIRIWGYATHADIEGFIAGIGWNGSRLEIPLERLRDIAELKGARHG
jgi:hypothetical protein